MTIPLTACTFLAALVALWLLVVLGAADRWVLLAAAISTLALTHALAADAGAAWERRRR